MADRIDTQTPIVDCDVIAGADISYNRFSPIMFAAVVVLKMDDMSIIDKGTAVGETHFPYVPGLLSFRESPIVLEAFDKLETRPHVIMCDGHGFAHPRRFGLACHLGLWLDLPSFGCAKSVLVGKYREPGPKAGSMSMMKDGDDIVGRAVRTRDRVKPVFVSVGHRIDLASAVRLSLRCCRGLRIPEPTRQAHLLVNELRREHSQSK